VSIEGNGLKYAISMLQDVGETILHCASSKGNKTLIKVIGTNSTGLDYAPFEV
jgi:hypothetical protein